MTPQLIGWLMMAAAVVYWFALPRVKVTARSDPFVIYLRLAHIVVIWIIAGVGLYMVLR